MDTSPSTVNEDLRRVTVDLPAQDVALIKEAAVHTGNNRTASLIRLLRIAGHIDTALAQGRTLYLADEDGEMVEVQFT